MHFTDTSWASTASRSMDDPAQTHAVFHCSQNKKSLLRRLMPTLKSVQLSTKIQTIEIQWSVILCLRWLHHSNGTGTSSDGHYPSLCLSLSVTSASYFHQRSTFLSCSQDVVTAASILQSTLSIHVATVLNFFSLVGAPPSDMRSKRRECCSHLNSFWLDATRKSNSAHRCLPDENRRWRPLTSQMFTSKTKLKIIQPIRVFPLLNKRKSPPAACGIFK